MRQPYVKPCALSRCTQTLNCGIRSIHLSKNNPGTTSRGSARGGRRNPISRGHAAHCGRNNISIRLHLSSGAYAPLKLPVDLIRPFSDNEKGRRQRRGPWGVHGLLLPAIRLPAFGGCGSFLRTPHCLPSVRTPRWRQQGYLTRLARRVKWPGSKKFPMPWTEATAPCRATFIARRPASRPAPCA